MVKQRWRNLKAQTKGKQAMTKVVLIGAGGHSKVIQDIVRINFDLKLYAVLDQSFTKREIVDGVIYGSTDLVDEFIKGDCQFCLAVGNNGVRQMLVDTFDIPLEKYLTLIHPTAVI